MNLAIVLQIIALAEQVTPGVVAELRALFAANPTATVDELITAAKATDAQVEATADQQIAADQKQGG